MKKLFAILSVCALLLAGCGKNDTAADTTAATDSPQIVTPTGEGQAVIPEEGDISIEIG